MLSDAVLFGDALIIAATRVPGNGSERINER
jgi:hypothetical protein